jgi:hypothetical protein
VTKNLSPDEFLALQLYQNPGHMLFVDFDGLVRQFGKIVANQMLDALVPIPGAARDWIVNNYVARDCVSLAVVSDGLKGLSDLIGLDVGVAHNRPWRRHTPLASGPVLIVTIHDNADFVQMAFAASRERMGVKPVRGACLTLVVEMLARMDDQPRLSTAWRDLIKGVTESRPALVIIDGRNGVLDGKGDDAARWFGSLTKALAKLHRCGVLVVSDMSEGESLAWHGAVNLIFALDGPPEDVSILRSILDQAVCEGQLVGPR